MALLLKKALVEADFQTALDAVSKITKADPTLWHCHIGGLIFDRYMFGSGASDFFDYGYLIMDNDFCVGFFSLEAGGKSAALDISIDKNYLKNYETIINAVVQALPKGVRLRMDVNIRQRQLCDALEHLRFSKGGESRAQYVFDLKNTNSETPVWESENISVLCDADITERAAHSALATQQRISPAMYKRLMKSPYYKYALDMIVRDNETGKMAGYIGFWFDENSKTALIEPVATVEAFRRRGIMKKAISHGLEICREKGLDHVYVSTEGENIPARTLYESLGFKRYGRVTEYFKII